MVEYSFYQHLTDTLLLAFMKGLHSFLVVEGARLNIAGTIIAALKAILDLFELKLKKVLEDNNHGHGDVVAKNMARHAAIAFLEDLVNTQIKHNPEWTPEDLARAGFPDPVAPQIPAPQIHSHVVLRVSHDQIGALVVTASDQHRNSIAMLDRNCYLEIRVVITSQEGAVRKDEILRYHPGQKHLTFAK
ncbi:hypothetical protein FACS1894137_12830 [Spirochaetia bacterium]|nr:hypothetical protein FACS1894137_12830 [Spirochaetia bacterium]